MGMGDEETLLKRIGLDFSLPESGCCGMAGAFGFEPGDHYDVSVACGERVLLPEVRRAGDDTLIIADGFSCREQIFQGTGRRALHVAEVIQMALHAGLDLEPEAVDRTSVPPYRPPPIAPYRPAAIPSKAP